jgi:hypothetical protein
VLCSTPLRANANRELTMYFFRSDDSKGLMIGAYSGSSDSESEWAETGESISIADDAALARSVPLVYIVAVTEDSTPPPPLWRKRMADRLNSIRSSAFYFALVAPDAQMLGVFTAIRWMIKPSSAGRISAAPTFMDAAKWVRKVSGAAYPSLESLYDEVRLASASSRRLVASRRAPS